MATEQYDEMKRKQDVMQMMAELEEADGTGEGEEETYAAAQEQGFQAPAMKKVEAPKDTSTLGKVGTGATVAGTASSNPYILAGGMAMSAIGSAQDRKLARETQEANNEISRREKVMSMMGNLGSGIGSIG